MANISSFYCLKATIPACSELSELRSLVLELLCRTVPETCKVSFHSHRNQDRREFSSLDQEVACVSIGFRSYVLRVVGRLAGKFLRICRR